MDSAELGYPIAQSNLGISYPRGENGFPRDPEAAVRLLEQAARGGFGAAAGYLANAYIEGKYLNQDLDRAEALLNVARQENVTEKKIKAY